MFFLDIQFQPHLFCDTILIYLIGRIGSLPYKIFFFNYSFKISFKKENNLNISTISKRPLSPTI